MTRIIVFFNVNFLIRAMFEMLKVILGKMDWLLSMNVIDIQVVVRFNYLNFGDLLKRRLFIQRNQNFLISMFHVKTNAGITEKCFGYIIPYIKRNKHIREIKHNIKIL